MSVTPESSPTSSRTDISQCPQVMPVTWYSLLVVMVVLLSFGYPRGVLGRGRGYTPTRYRASDGCGCRASARLHGSPHGFLGGSRVRSGLTGRPDVAQSCRGDECGESRNDSGDQTGGIQSAGERLLRRGRQGRTDGVGQLRRSAEGSIDAGRRGRYGLWRDTLGHGVGDLTAITGDADAPDHRD